MEAEEEKDDWESMEKTLGTTLEDGAKLGSDAVHLAQDLRRLSQSVENHNLGQLPTDVTALMDDVGDILTDLQELETDIEKDIELCVICCLDPCICPSITCAVL